jgi:TPR repeat protein
VQAVRDIAQANTNDDQTGFDPTARLMEPDFQRAANLYRKAVEKGYAPAMNNLTELYLHGLVGERDP